MTIKFSVSNITTENDIKIAISKSNDVVLRISFDTGETVCYNRHEMSEQEIISAIYDYIKQTQTELSSMSNDYEPTDCDLDAMYDSMCRRYENELQNRYDAEAAVLHHYI